MRWPSTVAMGMRLNVRVRAHLLCPVLQCTVSNANDGTESMAADWTRPVKAILECILRTRCVPRITASTTAFFFVFLSNVDRQYACSFLGADHRQAAVFAAPSSGEVDIE